MVDRFDAITRGSSPHTRGARRKPTPSPRSGGIIPAYAGSTPPVARAASPKADHPRIRGEHATGLSGVRLGFGSSPHTRGALQ